MGFNARTANTPDFLKMDKMDDIFHIENQVAPPLRNSEDKKICERGLNMVDLCKSLDFLIINGRKAGDIFGKYTSFQWNGKSVVDYVLSSWNFMDRLAYFEVGGYTPWLSDHCPLHYKLILKHDLSIIETPVAVTEMPTRFSWNLSGKTQFENNLNSEQIKNDFEILQNPDQALSSQKLVAMVTEIIMKCAQTRQFIEKTIASNTRKNSQPWFDKECVKTMNKMKKLSKRLKHSPENNIIHEELFLVRRNFKRIIRNKKLNYRTNLVEKMHLVHKKDVKQFWKIVDKLDTQTSKENQCR